MKVEIFAAVWFLLLIAGIVLILRFVFSKQTWLSITEKSRKTFGGYLDVESTETIKVPERKHYPKFIEAVCVCVGYADFLRQTLPYNRAHFDRLIIVTSSADVETQRVCEYWHIECVVTDVFYENGDVFNKAKGINEGLKRLSKKDWLVHFDADIYLPPRTRGVLELLPLDAENLYGIDRANCVGFNNWMKYFQQPERIHGNDGLLRLTQFPIGARLLNLDRDGYVPIGYFQLWNAKSGVTEYPDCHGAADRTDTLFAYNWTREKRSFIPELISIHLESEEAAMGANWQGRKTCPFEFAE